MSNFIETNWRQILSRRIFADLRSSKNNSICLSKLIKYPPIFSVYIFIQRCRVKQATLTHLNLKHITKSKNNRTTEMKTIKIWKNAPVSIDLVASQWCIRLLRWFVKLVNKTSKLFPSATSLPIFQMGDVEGNLKCLPVLYIVQIFSKAGFYLHSCQARVVTEKQIQHFPRNGFVNFVNCLNAFW